MKTLEEKIQTCYLCDALLKNIDDSFVSVSFSITDDNNVQVKFILSVFSQKGNEYINDAIADFTAKQSKDCILPPLIELAPSLPLANLVYAISNIKYD